MHYGAEGHGIEIEDRPLAHLKVATLSLLRAGRSVAFTFDRPQRVGGGRETVWISPSTDLRFRFRGSRHPKINERWVRAIIDTAETAQGLVIVPEPVH